MIEAEIKKEEYREIKPFWKKRLLRCFPMFDMPTDDGKCLSEGVGGCVDCTAAMGPRFKDYDTICFSYGYTKRRMLWTCKGITIGRGRPEWGAPDYEVFIIKLGKRIE